MRAVVVLVVSSVFVGICFMAIWQWDSRVNRGWKIGYWGEFNRMRNALSSAPGIRIVKQWQNCDVTLEEFGFTVETNGSLVGISFGEGDPIRTMPKATATARLQTLIQRELTSANPEKSR